MSTTLATKRDLLPVASKWDVEQLRQEIALLRMEVAGLRAEIGRVSERGLGSPPSSPMIYLGLIFFTGCALTVAFMLSWR